MSQIRHYLLRGATWSAGTQIINIALSFSASILLAKLLGVGGYGAYQFAMGWIALLGTFAGFGLARVIERELAASVATNNWGKVKGAIGFSCVLVSIISVILTTIILVASVFRPDYKVALIATAAFLLPIQALTSIGSAVMIGFKKVIFSTMPQIVSMCAFVLFLLLFWLTNSEKEMLQTSKAIYLQITAASIAFVVGITLVLAILHSKKPSIKNTKPVYEPCLWIKAGFPLMLIAGMLTINNQADILMLGMMVNDEAVGMYHAATRMSNFLAFALAAMIVPMRPLMSEFSATGQREKLQLMITKSTRIVFVLTLPLAAGFIFFGNYILVWIYGSSFSGAAVPLALLSIAQLMNVAAGPVQALLVMCGYEKKAAWGVALSTLVNLGLNAVLIPIYGMVGAAIATGLSLVVWNFVLIRETVKKLAIWPAVTGHQLIKYEGR